jgi:hypothetical protein
MPVRRPSGKLESEPIIFQIFLKVIVRAAPFGLLRSP